MQFWWQCANIEIAIHAPLPSLLALRRVSGGTESSASSPRRLQGLQCGTARVQDVRGVRHVVCQALQGAHGGGGAEKGRGEFLRSLQAQGWRLCGEGYRGACSGEVGARRFIQKVTGLAF